MKSLYDNGLPRIKTSLIVFQAEIDRKFNELTLQMERFYKKGKQCF